MKPMRLIALALALVLVLTGCGSSSYSMDQADVATTAVATTEAAEEASYVSDYYDSASGESAAYDTSSYVNSIAQSADAKLIYTGSLDLETTDLDATLQALNQMVEQAGGYFESQERYQYSTWCQVNDTIRVPAEQFSAFLNAVSDCEGCTVTYQNITAEDVGEAYADLENRLETLQIKLDRLQELLGQAENVEDLITVESAISDVEYEIESLTGQKNHYDSLIGYSTIYLTVNEVRTLSEGVSPTLGQRLSSGFRSGISDFANGCVDLLVWLVSHLLSVLCFAAIVVIVLLLLRRRRRRKQAKAASVADPTRPTDDPTKS
jgi:hypothetical protein